MRGFLPVVLLCIYLYPGTFALDAAKEGKVFATIKTLAVATSTLGFRGTLHSQQFSHGEVLLKLVLLTGVSVMSWIHKIGAWHVIVLNAVSHGASLVVYVTLRFRAFSKECLHTVLKGNVTGIVGVVMCLAIYCQLTSQILLLAVFLCGCSAVVLLAHKNEHRQAPMPRLDETISLHSRIAVNDEVIAIERFQQSYKPFVTWSIVCIIINFATAVLYQSEQRELCYVIISLMVTTKFRCYSSDSVNQGRIRWLFGWLCAGGSIFAVAVLVFMGAFKVNMVSMRTASITMLIGFIFFNISGIPTACRMIILLVEVFPIYAIPLNMAQEEKPFSIAV